MTQKLGRNEPCHCGSGKKYKQCCLSNDRQSAAIPKAESDDDVPALSASDFLDAAGAFKDSEHNHILQELPASQQNALEKKIDAMIESEKDLTQVEARIDEDGTYLNRFFYNPEKTPESDEWKNTNETIRRAAIIDFHERNGYYNNIDDSNTHTALHLTVENQIALGIPKVTPTAIKRLMSEGLSRHEALHAIGFVISYHELISKQNPSSDASNDQLERNIAEMTKAKWMKLTN